MATGHTTRDDQELDRELAGLLSVERFEPSDDEIAAAEKEATRIVTPGALQIRLDAAAVLPDVIDDLRELLVAHPGESDVVVELQSAEVRHRLRLGNDFRVSRGAGLHAELAQLLGSALLPVEAAAAA